MIHVIEEIDGMTLEATTEKEGQLIRRIYKKLKKRGIPVEQTHMGDGLMI